MGKRILLVFIIFVIGFIVVTVRLFFWQVTSFDFLKGIAESQTSTSLKIPAKRGQIFSSDGTPLVINQNAYLIYVEPNKIDNVIKTAEVLAKELDLSVSSVSAQIAQSKLMWLSIASKVEEDKVEAIKKASLSGVGFLEEGKRFYPEASMAAHLLGFVGKNSKGDDQGYFGIEGYYDEQLRGKDGVLHQEEDALGNPILSGNLEKIPPVNGRDLYLTLDKTIQFIVERKLDEGIDKYGASGGIVIVLEPNTGSILAMASRSSYDPNAYSKYPSDYYKNPAVSTSYEPGSTFKVLVTASAINEGKLKQDEKFDEVGPVDIGGYTINTWNQKYHGLISVGQILEYSSNVGMVFIGKKLGQDNLLKYINDLGFGTKTDIDLQEEASFPLRPKNKWYEIDYATASFGQGIAVTPLQMAKAVATIANGGRLMKPFIVKTIKSGNGQIVNIKPKIEKEVFKKETTLVITEMMVDAIDNGETRLIKPPGFRIAGKTGTAQIPIAGHYDAEKTIASFVGFAPVDNPKFVMLVSIREPTSSPWGSETAAPLFFAIAHELFSFLGVSPNQ